MASAILMAKIANDPDFQKRVEYYMTRKALAVAESVAPLPDGNDNTLIQRILRNQENVRLWAVAACTNSTIAAGTHAGDGSTVIDGDLEFQINSQWNAFKV